MSESSRPITAILQSPLARRTPLLLQYTLTAAAIIVVAGVRAVFVTDLLPWLLFVPIILVISLIWGRGPALFGLVIAAGAAALSLAGKITVTLAASQFWAATVVFLVVGALIVELGNEVRSSFERLLSAEAQLRLLNSELAHRLKNNLAMVQAIAFQTLRRSSSMQEARDKLNERLVALGRATDLLVNVSWQATDLHRVISAVAEPLGLNSDKLQLAGPNVLLGAQEALALSLVFHELATNAVKYGALSSEKGSISIRWERPASDRLWLEWQEHDGPTVIPPTRQGFGSALIERSLQASMPGTTALEFLPTGLRFTFDGSLADHR